MIECQKTIAEWANATFGPVTNASRTLVLANKYTAKLIGELADGDDSPGVIEEAASVAILLYRAADAYGGDLDSAVDAVPADHAIGRTAFTLASLVGQRITATLAAGEERSSAVSWTASANLAQALFFIHHIAGLTGDDLGEAIDRAMKRNRASAWRADGTGHGLRVKEGEDVDKAAAGLAEAVGLDWTLLDDREPTDDEWYMGQAQAVTRESFRNLARIAIEAAPVSPLLSFVYTNYRGSTERRRIRLLGVKRGATRHHPDPKEIVLRGYCLDREAERDFALSGIQAMR